MYDNHPFVVRRMAKLDVSVTRSASTENDSVLPQTDRQAADARVSDRSGGVQILLVPKARPGAREAELFSAGLID